jgi:pimeloyl-ACP methyl ester carboxylesterase
MLERLETAWLGPAPDLAPTLVFLHEGLGCLAMWRDFPEALAKATGTGAFVYSRFGYGRSATTTLPRPLTYMHEEAALLPTILSEAGIREAILVGHSDGGSIALIHAATGDARIRGLALEAPHVFCEDVSVASIAAAKEAFEKGDLRARLTKYHGDNVDVAFRGWNDAWLDPGFRAWNLEGLLPAITAEVLVVQGEDDAYGTLAQVDAIARGLRAPFTRCILPACGHAPHKDQREATLAVMTTFVRGVLGKERP